MDFYLKMALKREMFEGPVTCAVVSVTSGIESSILDLN